MRRPDRILFYISSLSFCLVFFASCKPPLPVYFDKPIGTSVQGFDTAIAGNYVPLDDVLDKGTKEFFEKYKVGYDKIFPANSSPDMNGKEVNYDDVNKIIGDKIDSGKVSINLEQCDSLFKTICSLNSLVATQLGSKIDKLGPAKPQAAIVKISYDRVFFIAVDSAGKNTRDTLLSLNPSVLLTRYAGKYFLNFKTEYGWEILQMEVWENKFLSARPFYFTSYDGCASSIPLLTASTHSIYPGMKPVFNKEKKVIGYKADLTPKLVLDKFKKSEEVVLLMRIN